MKRQTFRSQYGRPTISVTATCPTRELVRKLSRTHVRTSADDVETMVREAVAGARERGVEGWTKSAEETAVRFALWQHAENRAAYAFVMGGMVPSERLSSDAPHDEWLRTMIDTHGHGGI